MIVASGKKLFYYTFLKEKSNSFYKIDFLLSHQSKAIPLEIKSNKLGPHASLDHFCEKYTRFIRNKFLISTKNYLEDKGIINLPIYFLPLMLDELKENGTD